MANERFYKTEDDVEAAVVRLEGEIGVLKEALELLISNCSCTVPERMSGHHVDCAVPHVKELLNPTDYADYEEERISRAREG